MLNTKEKRLAAREFYIPKGARKIAMKDGAAVFYAFEDGNGNPCARCFIGTAGKPSWGYRFRSEAERARKIGEQISILKRNAEDKAARRAKANAGHNWEPGLILVSSWGYEQTNVDFYEVVEVIGKTMVKVEKIGSQVANDSSEGMSSMSCYVAPEPKARTGEFSRHKVSSNGIRFASYRSAYPWDGRKRYCSWYA